MAGARYLSELWDTPFGPVLLTERELTDGWWVAATISVVDTALVVSELRVFPGTDRNARYVASAKRRMPKVWNLAGRPWTYQRMDDGSISFEGGGLTEHHIGEWDRDPTGRDPVPSGGMTHAVLREVRLGELLTDARDQLLARQRAGEANLPTFPAADSAEAESLRRLSKAPPRTGRRAASEDRYLDIAVAYAARVEARSRRPRADLEAKMPGYSREDIRDLVHEARRRGLLTSAPRGRAGGELTEKAHRLLAERKADQ